MLMFYPCNKYTPSNVKEWYQLTVNLLGFKLELLEKEKKADIKQTFGLYHKHITIVNNDSSIDKKLCHSLERHLVITRHLLL
jgi:hypothetical protein